MSLWFILISLTLPLRCMKLKWGSVDFVWKSSLWNVEVYSTDIAHAVSQILAEAVTLRCPGKEHGVLILIRHTDKLRKIHCREVLFRFIDEWEFPIAQHLANELRDKISYNGSLSSVCRFLKSSALKYTETSDGCTVLLFHRMVKKLRVSEHLLPPIKPGLTKTTQKIHFLRHIRKNGLKVLQEKGGSHFVSHLG